MTGGATGIGKAMADRFGAEGAKVVICARREDRLQEAVEDLTDRGLEARYKVCDISKLDDVVALADYAWAEFGQVDAFVNSAGIPGIPEALIDSSEESSDAHVPAVDGCPQRAVRDSRHPPARIVSSSRGLRVDRRPRRPNHHRPASPTSNGVLGEDG